MAEKYKVMKEVKGYNPSKDPRLIDCKTECGNTKCYAKRYGLFAEKTCPNFAEPKPQTNADKIRSMTDEELANFIGFACQDAFAYGAGLRNKMLIYPFGTREETLGWLKAPVEEGAE